MAFESDSFEPTPLSAKGAKVSTRRDGDFSLQEK